MAKTASMKPVKYSTAKLNGKTPTGDKTLGVDTVIRLYEIEDSDNIE